MEGKVRSFGKNIAMQLLLIRILPLLFILGIVTLGFGQSGPFSFKLNPVAVDELPGIQSFAHAQYGDQWVIIGGRLDGLHQRQPFASFDLPNRNNQITIVNPSTKTVSKTSLVALSPSIREQLSSTNMQYFQEGRYLYLTGGYGYSETKGDHITFPYITAVDVVGLLEAITNNQSIAPYFRQQLDEKFAVSGGDLEKIGEEFYLVGGHRFDGRYNPMGPDHGPGFSQAYTNAIRKFTIQDNGTTFTILHKDEVIDERLLHRRDYNVAPQIFPDGQEGLTAFSGVFQKDVDLPFLTAVNISATKHEEQPDFFQYFNHYHCAHIPAYSAKDNEMHTIFFGGIAQYYQENEVLIQDNAVPFVKTIARVTRDQNGIIKEYKHAEEMPGYLGAGSEFIPLPNIPVSENGVILLDEVEGDSILIGYIYGGIHSSAKNIFFINTGNQSDASATLFEVYLIKSETTSNQEVNPQSHASFGLQVFPNPTSQHLSLKFHVSTPGEVALTIRQGDGRLVLEKDLGYFEYGEHLVQEDSLNLRTGIYLISLQTPYRTVTQKMIIR